jgi:[1-hydroxy-2-(trimethylamino)ethyl]phosphonate dioxygenase
MSAIDQILDLLEAADDRQYGNEGVSQQAHALQAASLAEREGVADSLIAAALLHDLGHLLAKRAGGEASLGRDDRHEHIAGGWLRDVFPAAVVEPIRLHVAAKRYLCATDRNYFGLLSPPSVRSLELQGGFMSDKEVRAFRRLRFHDEAVRVRRWDERAKLPDAPVRPVAEYAPLLRTLARA